MDSKINCICNLLEEIDSFSSISEFERFQAYIAQLIVDGYLEETIVKKRFAGFDEQWHKCATCGQTWRLVHPDFPFKGLWKIVDYNCGNSPKF